jgi:hypothetical protein
VWFINLISARPDNVSTIRGKHRNHTGSTGEAYCSSKSLAVYGTGDCETRHRRHSHHFQTRQDICQHRSRRSVSSLRVYGFCGFVAVFTHTNSPPLPQVCFWTLIMVYARRTGTVQRHHQHNTTHIPWHVLPASGEVTKQRSGDMSPRTQNTTKLADQRGIACVEASGGNG